MLIETSKFFKIAIQLKLRSLNVLKHLMKMLQLLFKVLSFLCKLVKKVIKFIDTCSQS